MGIGRANEDVGGSIMLITARDDGNYVPFITANKRMNYMKFIGLLQGDSLSTMPVRALLAATAIGSGVQIG